MLGWRKRNDGFEWRDYVRTTILVRRKHRRDRVGEAGRAAVDNLKAAGQRGAVAGAEGAKAVGRGAVQLGQQGAIIGAAGAKVVGEGVLHYGKEGAKLGAAGAKLSVAGAMAGVEKLREAAPVAGNYLQRFGAALLYAIAYAWAVLRTLGGIVADYVGPPLAPTARYIRQPGVRLAMLLVGGVALLGGINRANANGFERDTWIALGIGIVLLSAVAAAHVALGLPQWLTSPFASISRRGRESFEAAAAKPAMQKGFAALVLALLIAGAFYALRGESGPTQRSRHAREETRQSVASADVEGRGSALSGDTLRVGSTTVRLNGIEAPLRDQSCGGADGQPSACGEAARLALVRLLRAGRVACDISGSADGRSAGDCRVDDRDIAAELVRGGYVFASTGLFAAYSGIEREARANKVGIWAGEAVRPSEYRESKWAEAKRGSPDGCPIKGSVRGGRRLYLVPWARGYEEARVTASRGERWFCSELEAQDAGFKPAES
jgi:endonuclease YncB( thermonuclease family)